MSNVTVMPYLNHVKKAVDPPDLPVGNFYQPIEGDTIVDGNGDKWYIILTDDEKLLICAREGDDGRMVPRTLDAVVTPVAATRMFTNIDTSGKV